MPRPLHLEDFGSNLHEFVPETIDGSHLESERLAAFDKGYAAGWDDATKAAEQEAKSAQDAARTNLQDLGFTFHEARAHVMLGMTPLLKSIVAQILPTLLRDTIGARILEELETLTEEASDTPIDLFVPEGDLPAMEAALADVTTLPISIREEASLEHGQLYLRLGESERQIDLAALGTRITDALTALDTLNKDVLKHG